MDPRTTERLSEARNALDRLKEVLEIDSADRITRDAAITRFTFTVEIVWRAARAVLLDRFGAERLDLGGPKAIVRECRNAGLLTDEQAAAALGMIDDRNLVAHTYKETVATDLRQRMSNYADLLEKWHKSLTANLIE